ncbi:MAG: hypothetical protein OQJ89_16095, partial [Kangiellaceae bacterium]|nr:hypothetical protein [Kangiellaceae bacterium]
MIYKALAFLLGMMSLLVLRSSTQALVVVAASISIFILSKFLQKNLGIVAYLLFGLFWASSSVIYWDNHAATLAKVPYKARVEGTICSLPVLHHSSSDKNSLSQNKAYRFDFCINHFAKIERYSKSIDFALTSGYENISFGQMNKIKVSWSQYTNSSDKVPKAGDVWHLELKLRPIHSKYNPLTNDRAKWLLASNYAGTGSVRNASFIGEPDNLVGLYHRQRNRLYDHLLNLVGDKPNAGLVVAIILGDKSLIKEEQWD